MVRFVLIGFEINNESFLREVVSKIINLLYEHEYDQAVNAYKKAWQEYRPYLESMKMMSKEEFDSEEKLHEAEKKFIEVRKKMFGEGFYIF